MAATQPSELVLDHVGPVQCRTAVTWAIAAHRKIEIFTLHPIAINMMCLMHAATSSITITQWASTVRR